MTTFSEMQPLAVLLWRWNRNGSGSLSCFSAWSHRRTSRIGLPVRVSRRMISAITWNSSADMGMTRSRSVLDGAITSSPMTSPLGRWYCRMLRWLSSSSSSMRTPVSRRVWMTAQVQNAVSSVSSALVTVASDRRCARTGAVPSQRARSLSYLVHILR